MIFLDVKTGKPLQNVAYEGDLNSMEFFEQFNEFLLIKPINKPLRLYNVITQKNCTVQGFETPDAFFFLYEKEMIVCVADGHMLVYRVSDGALITNFGNQEIYTKFATASGIDGDEAESIERNDSRYVVNLSESRSHLFTLMRDDALVDSLG